MESTELAMVHHWGKPQRKLKSRNMQSTPVHSAERLHWIDNSVYILNCRNQWSELVLAFGNAANATKKLPAEHMFTGLLSLLSLEILICYQFSTTTAATVRSTIRRLRETKEWMMINVSWRCTNSLLTCSQRCIKYSFITFILLLKNKNFLHFLLNEMLYNTNIFNFCIETMIEDWTFIKQRFSI